MAADKGGTVAKGLALLRALGSFPRGATAAELAALSGHPFSTAYRLLGSLVDTGFVDYDPASKRYAVGLPVFELAQRVAHARGFAGTALPVLQRVTTATGESSLLMVRDGDETLTIHKVDGPQYRSTTDPGDRAPIHSSAAGKAILASLPLAEREAVVARIDLAQRTPSTVTDRAALLEQLAGFAARGFAGQSEEHDVGMNAIAVPVRRADGATIGALALAAPVFRADLAALEAHVPRLREAADELATLLPAD